MMEEVKEHQITPVRFSMINPQSPGGKRAPFSDDTFAIPSVVVPKKRQRTKKRQGICTAKTPCYLRVLILISIYPIFYYQKEIKEMLLLAPAHTKISAPTIKRDYSSIQGAHDLSSEIVKPWCFRGGQGCPCQDPLVPVMGDSQNWEEDFLNHKDLANSEDSRMVDVVFFGDSIIKGIPVDGINSFVFGIEGDTSPNLLWRLKNGELPDNLYPSTFWIMIGTNDVVKTWCSPEIVVIGILRVVEEILSRKVISQVIIHGILPHSFNRDGYVAKGGQFKPSIWQDIKAINEELKMYARYRERVFYHETNVFFKDPKATTADLQIDKDFMPDFMNPSAKGYQLWGEEITAKLEEITQETRF